MEKLYSDKSDIKSRSVKTLLSILYCYIFKGGYYVVDITPLGCNIKCINLSLYTLVEQLVPQLTSPSRM